MEEKRILLDSQRLSPHVRYIVDVKAKYCSGEFRFKGPWSEWSSTAELNITGAPTEIEGKGNIVPSYLQLVVTHLFHTSQVLEASFWFVFMPQAITEVCVSKSPCKLFRNRKYEVCLLLLLNMFCLISLYRNDDRC